MSILPETAALQNVARAILNATQIVTNAPGTTPGRFVTIDILPGLLPQLPASSRLGNITDGVPSSGLGLNVPPGSDAIEHITGTLPASELTGTLSGSPQTLELSGSLAGQTLSQALTGPPGAVEISGTLAGPSPNAPTQAVKLTGSATGDALSGTIESPAQAIDLAGTLSALNLNATLSRLAQPIALSVSVPQQLISGVINSLASSVDLGVNYAVRNRDTGDPVSAHEFTQLRRSPALPGSDSLNVSFLFRPPLGDDASFTPALRYSIEITVTVTVRDPTVGTAAPSTPGSASQTFSVPVDVPALEIPAVLLLGMHPNFDVFGGDPEEAGYVIVMVRAGSPVSSLGGLVQVLKRLLELVRTLQQVLGWGTSTTFAQGIERVLSAIANAPTVHFIVGNSPDVAGHILSASSIMLIGIQGMTATVYNHWLYNSHILGMVDAHEAVVRADPILFGDVPTGVGVSADRWLDLSSVNWRTAPRHMNDQIHSVRFGGIVAPPGPPKPGFTVTVTPLGINFGDPVDVTVRVTDRATRQGVANASVTIHNFDSAGLPLPPMVLAAGAEVPPITFSSPAQITFHPRKSFDPQRRRPLPNVPPSGVVTAPGYVSAFVPFDFPDMPEDLTLIRERRPIGRVREP